MLKVLIADDEKHVITHLQTHIPWTQLGLEVVATANDGAEALRFARQIPIDIVISDIRMPNMDGLELCRRIREENQLIQFIILSGYADFSYAKRAIELQVLGYCLKPVDTADLTGLLRTAVKNSLKEQLTNGDALLDSIEDGNAELTHRIFREQGIDAQRIYVAASVGVHNIEKELHAALSYKLGKHKYLYFSAAPFHHTVAEKMICYASGRSGIGIYPSAADCGQLQKVIGDVLIMAFQFFVNGKATLCSSVVSGPLSDEVFARLDAAQGNAALVRTLLEELSHADCSLLFNILSAFRFYNHISMYTEAINGAEKGESILYGYEQLASDYENFHALLQDLIRSIEPKAEAPSEPEQGMQSSFLPILRYLNENYEKDISLKKVSEKFHMNSSYISQLIKAEMGLSYTQYVTELRIEKAKQLLKNSHLSLLEISEAVGFNDYFYFIKKFKKEVGVTPGKYV